MLDYSHSIVLQDSASALESVRAAAKLFPAPSIEASSVMPCVMAPIVNQSGRQPLLRVFNATRLSLPSPEGCSGRYSPVKQFAPGFFFSCPRDGLFAKLLRKWSLIRGHGAGWPQSPSSDDDLALRTTPSRGMQYTVMCSRCQPGPKAGTLKILNASVAPESVAWIPSSRVAGNRAVFLIDLDKGAESQGDANVRSICSRDQAIGQQRWLNV